MTQTPPMRQTIGNNPTPLPTAVLTPSPASHITTLGLITRNRPTALGRAVQSYLPGLPAHTRLMVLDDSDSEAEREANVRQLQTCLAHAPTSAPIEIQYANPAQRLAFVNALIAQDIAPPAIIRFGLDHSEHLSHAPRTGINRNALLLASGGEVLFSADDDTLYTPARRAGAELVPGMDLVVGEDPAEKYFWATEEDALNTAHLVPASDSASGFDFWAEHTAVLTKTGPDLCTAVDIPPHALNALPSPLSALAQRLQNPASRVVATLNGLVGDSGLGFPFGFTGTAVGCLLPQTTATHHALTHDESHYQTALTSRATLRVAPRLTLSDGSYTMTTFVGLDNRHLLPPFMPLFRAQDMIWGQTIWRTDATALLAHLPLTLRHAPLESRRFWPGEFMRSATGYDTTRLVLDCLMSYEPHPYDSRAGLLALGQYLQALGEQSLPDFAHFVQKEALRRNELFLTNMETTLARFNHQPAYWANDVKRYMQTMRHAMQADEYIVPVDLRINYQPRQALAMGQTLIRLFGEFLAAWPDIVAASHDLRQAERGMTTAVGGL